MLSRQQHRSTEELRKMREVDFRRKEILRAAREHCRMSSLPNERDALRLAEAGYGWEEVRGDFRFPRVSDALAKRLVLGLE